MSNNKADKPKLVHNIQPGTPEFDSRLIKCVKEPAARYLADDNSLGDYERGLLACRYDHLLISDEKLAKEEEAMEQAQNKNGVNTLSLLILSK